jgi:hypothetical protein
MITLQPGEQEIDVIKTASLELHLTTQRIFQVSNLGALKTVQIIPLSSVNSFGFITKHFEKLLLFAGVSLLAMFVLLLYPMPLYYPVLISEEDAIKYAFFLLLIAIGLTIAWWETRTVGIGICSQSGKTLLFFPTVGKTAPMRIQFLGKLQFALKKGNMQLFDEATMQRFATATSSSPFEMLPAEQKMPALFGSVVLLVIVVGLFLFKAVPPLLYEMEAYLAEMKAEKIASTVNAVKTAEPEQITTAPQPPTRVEEKKPTPSVPNEPPAASSDNNSTMGIITGEGVRMRSSMDKTSKANIIDKFAKGTTVEILERNGEWVKVRVKEKSWLHRVSICDGKFWRRRSNRCSYS